MTVQIVRLEDVDSTSLEARRVLEKQAPFSSARAFIASSQSQGKGQQGKTWKSPQGNLYLSIVLPYRGSLEKLQSLPLHVSCVVAEAVREVSGIRATLKWPNDLLFSGAKFGGILCETGVWGEVQHIIVGIGLNVASFPKQQQVDIPVTSLNEICGRAQSLEKLEKKIVERLSTMNVAEVFESFRPRYESFAVRSGHAYYNAQGQSEGVLKDYDETGALVLVNEGEQKTWNAAQQSTKVWFQKPGVQFPMLLVDIGNTSVKIMNHYANMTINSLGVIHRINVSDLNKDPTLLEEFFSGKEKFVGVCSVNNTTLELIREQVGAKSVLHVPAKRAIRLQSHYNLRQMGMDRWLNLEAVLEQYYEQGRATLVISMGTATTADFIDPHGQHLGGYIVPSLHLLQMSLAQNTDQLPELNEASSDSDGMKSWGVHTEEAIRRGTELMYDVFLKSLLADDQLKIIVTGGAPFPALPDREVIRDPLLTFKGLDSALRSGL